MKSNISNQFLDSISKGLILKPNGIWSSNQSQKISYPDEGNATCFAIEDRSFWFIHRNQCIITALQRHIGLVHNLGSKLLF
jgi:hypothetical protein